MPVEYHPSSSDREAIKSRLDMLKVSGDRAFATLQGEGVTAGQPAVFLRLHFCNLDCTWCDTKYTWDKNRQEFWQEPVDWTYSQTANNVITAWDEKFGAVIGSSEKRLVITGGEPLLQQRKIVELLKYLPGWAIELETNGTITPVAELTRCQINCSPKLSNSGITKDRRFRPAALLAINAFPNSWFKFVVVDPTDLAEVDEIVAGCSLAQEKVIIMPEGSNLNAAETHLQNIKGEVLKRGWKVTKRNQLEWYGNTRRT